MIDVDEAHGRFDEKIIGEEEKSELNDFIKKIRNNEKPKMFYGLTREGFLVFVKRFGQKRGVILKDTKTKKIIGYYLGSDHDEYMRYLRMIK